MRILLVQYYFLIFERLQETNLRSGLDTFKPYLAYLVTVFRVKLKTLFMSRTVVIIQLTPSLYCLL